MSTVVHISSCGRHLFVLLCDNRLLLIEDYARLIEGVADITKISTVIVFGQVSNWSSCYFTHCDDKVSVVTVSPTHHICISQLILMDP
jgi:hypothetical protein